jgi:hypothetical protein
LAAAGSVRHHGYAGVEGEVDDGGGLRELTETERRVLVAVAASNELDLRVGDAAQDDPLETRGNVELNNSFHVT